MCGSVIFSDVLALATALSDLAVSTRRTRTALWCGMQLSSTDLPKQCIRQASAEAKKFSASDLEMRNEIDEAESDNEACDYVNEFGLDGEYNEHNDYDDELSKDSDLHQEFDSEVGDDACFDDEMGNTEDQSLLNHKVDKTFDYDLDGMVHLEGSNDSQFCLQLDEDQTEQRSSELCKVSSDHESYCAEAGRESEGKSCSDKAEGNAFSDDSEAWNATLQMLESDFPAQVE